MKSTKIKSMARGRDDHKNGLAEILPEGANWQISSPLTTEDKKSKRRREIIDQIQDSAILVFVLITLSTLLYICVTILNSPSSSVDDKKWATSIITSIAGGALGYLAGKKSK